MVKPKCPKCGHDTFGALEQQINGYMYNGIFICCVECETTVGGFDGCSEVWQNDKSFVARWVLGIAWR